MPYWLRSSSREPDFRDLALPLNLLWNFRCVHMKGGAGLVPKMLVSGLEILPYEHFIPVTGIKAGWILAVWMALSCFACCIFHIISILFNCSDTALGVAEAMIGMKVKFFCFTMFALFLVFGARSRPQDLWPFLISETELKFLIWTQGEIPPGSSASPVNRPHVKRLLTL